MKEVEIKERAKKLIDAIVGDNSSDELRRKLMDWLLGIPEGGVAEEALAEWVTQNVKPKTSMPDKRERRAFAKLAALLGIEPVKSRTPRRLLLVRVAAVLVPILVVLGATFFYLNRGAAVETYRLYAGNSAHFTHAV